MGGEKHSHRHSSSSRKHSDRDKSSKEGTEKDSKDGAKRKRGAEDDDSVLRAPKRVAVEVVVDLVSKNADLREWCRSQIRQLYLHYATLVKAASQPNADIATDSAALQAFQGLLAAAQGASCRAVDQHYECCAPCRVHGPCAWACMGVHTAPARLLSTTGFKLKCTCSIVHHAVLMHAAHTLQQASSQHMPALWHHQLHPLHA